MLCGFGGTGMSLRKIIAANVRSLRLEKGWTLEYLGKKAKLGPPYLSRLEKTQNVNVTTDNIEAIARALGISPAELVSPSRPVVVAEKDSLESLEHALRLLESFRSRVSVGRSKG
jgi:transcriptional regulator with XRE-family HTH domain